MTLTAHTVRDMTMRRCRFNDNYNAAVAIIARDSLIEDCEFNNNTRYANGTTAIELDRDFSMSFTGIDSTIRRCKFNNNPEKGFRNDMVAERVTVENCEFNNNGAIIILAWGCNGKLPKVPSPFATVAFRETDVVSS
jgi:hypothetical protein